jgi:hypothetical protein
VTTRSRIAYGVRVLCGEPSDAPLEAGGLPEHAIYEVLTGVESSMLIDLNLSDQNRRVQSKTIPLQASTYDFALNASTASVPVFAQIKYDPTDTFFDPVDIVNLANIDRAGTDGRMAVAFYGTPLRARLSWIPQAGDNHTLTVWYDKTIDSDGSLSDSPPIEDAYTEHLKLQATAHCRELMKLDIGTALAAGISKGEEQWRKYVSRNGQQGLIEKTPYRPRSVRRGEFVMPGGRRV